MQLRRSLALAIVLAALPLLAAPKDDDRKAVADTMHSYAHALEVSPPHEIAAFYATDGELLLPGMAPVAGPAGVEAFLMPMASKIEVASATVEVEHVEVTADAAVAWGTYAQKAGERGKEKQTYTGRFGSEWHRGTDGRWRIFRLMMQPM